VNDHLALIEKIQASDKLKTKLDAKQLKNIADYIRMIPAEASMKLWKIAGNANVYNAVELHKLCNDYIVSIMTGGSNKK
jgi:predicted nucleic acid-binding Zn finger protein